MANDTQIRDEVAQEIRGISPYIGDSSYRVERKDDRLYIYFQDPAEVVGIEFLLRGRVEAKEIAQQATEAMYKFYANLHGIPKDRCEICNEIIPYENKGKFAIVDHWLENDELHNFCSKEHQHEWDNKNLIVETVS